MTIWIAILTKLLVYSLPQRKTPSQADTLQCSSLLLPKRRLSTTSLKTWSSLLISTITLKASNSSPKMLESVSRKSDNSTRDSRNLEISTMLHSDSLRFLPKTRDLCSSRMLLRSTRSSINNSTRRRRLPLSQPTSWALMKKVKYSKLWEPTHKMLEKKSFVTSRLTALFSEDSRCTLSLNSWTWVSQADLIDLTRRSRKWSIENSGKVQKLSLNCLCRFLII